LESSQWKVLFKICVYLPYEDGHSNVDAYVDELSQIESLIDINLDCHVAICGDFNVDFSRNWLHTALFNSFCENVNIKPVCGHSACTIDYTYNFEMVRFIGSFFSASLYFSKRGAY